MLAWLEAIGLKALFDFLWNKLTSWIGGVERDRANQAKEEAQANQDMKKAEELKPTSSKKEQEDAAQDAFKHL